MKNDFELVKAAVYNSIGVGRANATTREELAMRTGYDDRDVRRAIEMLRRDFVIVHVGRSKGYCIPEKTPQGVADAKAWIKSQESRIKSIGKGIKVARKFVKETDQIAGQMEMFR